MGRYTCFSKDFRIEMLLDSNGMKHVRINGHLYPGTFDVGVLGSPHDTYSFIIEDGKLRHEIRIDILWDNNSGPIAVAGFYAEWLRAVKPEFDDKLIRVRVFKPKFHRIDLENLPSFHEAATPTPSPSPQP